MREEKRRLCLHRKLSQVVVVSTEGLDHQICVNTTCTRRVLVRDSRLITERISDVFSVEHRHDTAAASLAV